MQFAKRRLSKIADEGRRLFNLEGIVQKSAALLNFAALLSIFYLILPVAGSQTTGITKREFLVLGLVSTLLAVNFLQFIIMWRLRIKWTELEKRSTHDELTGTFNRACFEEILLDETRRAGRYHYPLTLCLIDLDNFKSFNDSFGHPKGDDLLQRFSRLTTGRIRVSDCVSRYGGDEFCILLPHTDLVQAEKFLSRLLVEVQEVLDTTFSAGVTSYRAGENRTDFLTRADQALYQAKREGKNRIRCLIGKDGSQAVLSF